MLHKAGTFISPMWSSSVKLLMLKIFMKKDIQKATKNKQ
jgi:hypothetical protein